MRGAGLGLVVGGLVVLVALGPLEALFIAPALTLAALVIAVARAGALSFAGRVMPMRTLCRMDPSRSGEEQ